MDQTRGAANTGYRILENGRWREETRGEVIEEAELCVYVNGRELVTIAATPVELEALALGFLANQGWLASIDEVREIRPSQDGQCLDIWLDHDLPEPERKVLTSGCGGGVTFDHLVQRLQPLGAEGEVKEEDLAAGMAALYSSSRLYPRTHGVHTSVLWREGAWLPGPRMSDATTRSTNCAASACARAWTRAGASSFRRAESAAR